MDYNNLTKEELIERVEELQMLNRQLLEEKEQETLLDFPWTGNLGHWYWNIKTNSVTFNPLKIITLGYAVSEIPEKVDYQFFTDKLHPGDYQKTMRIMFDHLHGKTAVYEAEYRIRTKEGNYKWYYDRGKVTQYDENGKPEFLAGIVFDITEKKEMQLELEHKNRILAEQSSTDGLTQLKNHRALIEHLKEQVSIVELYKLPLSIAIFDIDDFKKINDSKGHVYGDKVLVDIANIMKRNVREKDIVGRYGGEEFMVVLPQASLQEAFEIAERIRLAIQGYEFWEGVRVTISAGIKEFTGEDIAELIHAADENLYKAKKSGKNMVIK